VTISDRRSINPDRTHLYYVSFYLESHRFHTKYTLIYLSIVEKEERKDKVLHDI
jgi:hypothetical protein